MEILDDVAEAGDILKVWKNIVASSENKTNSSFLFTLVFSRLGSTYVILDMNCDVELVQKEFDLDTDLDGLVFVEYSKTVTSKIT